MRRPVVKRIRDWRYRTRLAVGLLAVSVPITVFLVVALAQQAATSLIATTEQVLVQRAVSIGMDVDRWIVERSHDLQVAASALAPGVGDPAAARRHLDSVAQTGESWDAVALVDPSGRVLSSTAEEFTVNGSSTDWLREAAAGNPVVSDLYRDGDELRWMVAEPVLTDTGGVAAVVVGDLRIAALAELIGSPGFGRTAELRLVDGDSRLIYSTDFGPVSEDSALLAAGTLGVIPESPAARASVAGGSGVARFRDYRGREVFAGYAPIPSVGWGAAAKLDSSEALAPVRAERLLGVLVAAVGAFALTGFALIFARAEARHLTGIAEETTRTSLDVRTNAQQLSAASDDLAATTTQQSAAVTQTSATMEELARAAASIAETVDEVAAQASETRGNLELAEADVQDSSERTLRLADRVNDISDILELINDIADQTNLLALNAAIEAARAGESGRGFSVVADEVRRLAERSKSSAADIQRIVESTQSETNATLMAMEKGAKQMQVGLQLLEQVADATAQVRLTTQQQRSATEQVVETMEQATEASRRISSTAQQVAASAQALAELASELERTAATTRYRL